jgi:hypothetical protein
MATDFYDTSYEIQRANAQRTRALKNLQAQQRASNLGLSTSSALRDVNRQYSQGLEPRVSTFGRRGLGRSGLFQRAMKDYATAQQRAVGDVYARQQQELAGIDLDQQQADLELQNALDTLALQKQQQIISDAAKLADFTGFFG